jgi:ketosteroid isomerase-like protein
MKTLLFMTIAFLLYINTSAQSSEKIKDEVWQRELQYWEYVKSNDTTGYRTLWHDNFLGYPDTERITGKDKIANWLKDMHSNKDRRYEFVLNKKIVNPFGDIVITFYDETDIWKNDKNEIVLQEAYRITHTWKKFGDTWLIIGGMSALKRK